MQASSEKLVNSEAPLQLLLFVDKRPSSKEQIQRIQAYLATLNAEYPFCLQVVDVEEQPYLAEHFKLVATPALVKIHPQPRHTLAGTDLVNQIGECWERWQGSVENYLQTIRVEAEATQNGGEGNGSSHILHSNAELESSKLSKDTVFHTSTSIVPSAELIRLSDEIFRLKQEKEQLEDQLLFKDRIIAMLAHDLRNPLTAASIALETLEMGYSPKEGQETRLTANLTAQLLKHARTQTKAIDRLITDILQAARSNNAELRIHPQKLQLKPLCKDVLEYLSSRFLQKSQTIESDIPQDLPPVYADEERIRQVLVNLLDNAIKYTPVRGNIQLAVLHRTTQKIQVSICDNGPGVPQENQERIFEEHFRLERDASKEGYGIGLALCQRIIRAHYGRIWVDSSPNQGSCFHFTLPVHRY
jgi:two-component system, OmpR family, clock-associated histidine kinase SasA